MKSWYPPSYSEIARKCVEKCIYGIEHGNVDYRWVLMFFENSYRPKLSRYRMAKAFGRLRRAEGRQNQGVRQELTSRV